MSELPQPGPGRPHHSSYCKPGPLMTLPEAAIMFLVLVALLFLL